MEQETRDRLFDVASRLFAEKGYGGVSFQDIAVAAGAEVAQLTELFDSIDILYEAVLAFHFGQYRTRMETALTGDDLPAVKIERMTVAICELRRQVPQLFPLFYRELLNPTRFFEPIVKQQIRHIAYLSDTNIARGMQKKTFKRGINPAHATMVLLGIFHYHFLAGPLLETLLPASTDYEAYRAEALTVFLSGLTREPQ